MTFSTTDELLGHADWLARLARALCRSETDAEDAVQETLIRATTAQRGPDGPARPWLAGILRNVLRGEARSSARRERHIELVESAATQRSTAEDAMLLERQRLLLEHIDALPEAQRRVVLARYFEGLPPRRIARAEGVATAAVQSRLRRALATLRTRLDAEFGDRAQWMAWIGPVAALGDGARTSRRLLAAMAMLVVTGITAGALALRSGADGGAPSMPAGAERHAVTDEGQSGAVSAPPFAPETQAARVAAGLAPTAATVLVVAEATGTPISGATVLVVDSADIAPLAGVTDEAEAESLLLELGSQVHTDGEGRADIPLPAAGIVYAWTDSLRGFERIETAISLVRIELAPAESFAVEVCDEAGKRVPGATPIRISVVAGDPRDPSGVSSSRFEFERAVEDGWARFSNPLAGMRLSLPSDGDRISVTHVALDLPGAPEHHPRAASRTELPLRPSTLVTIGGVARLERPSNIGAVEVRVTGPGGGLLTSVVEARLSFPTGRGGAARYAATVVDGVARWPEVLAGAHPMRVHLSVPLTGQHWEVDAASPEHAGSTRRITTRRPVARTIRARLVDESGKPHAKRSVELHYQSNRETGFVPYLAGETDEDGVVEFSPDASQRSGRAIGLALHRWSLFGERAGVVSLDRERGDLAAGGDLGEFRIELVKPTKMAGRVVGPSGEPIGDARISATLEGRSHSHSARSRADGTFALEAVFGASTRIEARTPDGRFAPAAMEVRPDEIDGALELRLGRTTTVVATLDVSGLDSSLLMAAAKAQLRVWLAPGRGNVSRSWMLAACEPAADALTATFENVAPGAYEVHLRLGNGASFQRMAVTVPTSATTVRLVELDGLRLADHLRPVRVTGTLDGAPVEVETHVVDAEGRAILETNARTWFEPYRSAAGVTFRARGARAVVFEAPLPQEEFALEFEQASEVTVQFVAVPGNPASRARASARVEGGPSAGLAVDLGPVSEAARVRFPVAGTYRLFLEEPPKQNDDPTSEMISITQPEATEVLFDVPPDAEEIVIPLPR